MVWLFDTKLTQHIFLRRNFRTLFTQKACKYSLLHEPWLWVWIPGGRNSKSSTIWTAALCIPGQEKQERESSNSYFGISGATGRFKNSWKEIKGPVWNRGFGKRRGDINPGRFSWQDYWGFEKGGVSGKKERGMIREFWVLSFEFKWKTKLIAKN